LSVTFKANKTSVEVQEILKNYMKSVENRVGINALKIFRIGRALIETNTKRGLQTLGKVIKDNCGECLEKQTHKLRNICLFILDIPDDIYTSNIEEILIAQKLGLKLSNGDI